tara:strand:+ start:337 stop:1407 length:1071 start_codon:yes stop_codon:yes gene_type:complete
MNKNLSLFFISLIITVIVIEIFFKIFYPQELTSPFRVYGKDGLLLNVNNNNAYHFFKERKIKYRFGEYHNRIYNFEKNEKKILVLGDSFTFGWLLKDENTYVYKLNKKFSNYYFVNAAAGGWGTSDQLKYLTEFCKIIRPMYTIIFIGVDDFGRSKNSNLFYLDKNGEIKLGKNKVYKIEVLTENFLYKIAVENSHLLNFLRKEVFKFINQKKSNNETTNKNHKENYSKIIKSDKIKSTIEVAKEMEKENKKNKKFKFEKKLFLKINEEVKKCESQLILINLGWEDYNNNLNLEFLRKAKNFFEAESIKFIDLIDNMKFVRNNRQDYIIEYDSHPNELGNQIIFELVSKKLINLLD